MPTGQIDLDALARRLASRDGARTEANVQSGLHAWLLAAPLELAEQDLHDIVLEQQAGARHRIDVEVGLCVFEVKRDLRRGKVREEAVTQLAGYVTSRTRDMGQRYVGVLTDGAEWLLYRLVEETLRPVSIFLLDADRPDVSGLCVWLEGVLATAEKLSPTPIEIERRLGATSPAYALDAADVHALYKRGRELPSVRLKRELWARLLTTAFGTGFPDTDELFINHTLLVATAEIIAHAVMGLDPTAQDVSPAAVLSGRLFTQAQVSGVVDADFFDWVLEVEGGEAFIRALARRLTRFTWKEVEHDVLKVLYESVISAAQRKGLGEYYTPDWLASQVVETAVDDPLNQRVLDPACGSGTFLFHAIRRYLDAAKRAGLSNAAALEGVTERVFGMDIHPVAVTFARVTYLLAIGTDRLRAADRPALSVPVYLGDSIQWGQSQTLFSDDAIVIQTTGSGLLWGTELRFPGTIVGDARRFDRLVAELAHLAAGNRQRGAAIPSIDSILRRYSIPGPDGATLRSTFETMCRLHDNGANHIWGYYARNLARPFWLALEQNRVDVLVGNPPWLSYRYMTAEMQRQFRALSEERGLWAGSAVATHQDLSALFVLKAIERYLKADGRFAFVMPWAALRSRNFVGFRAGFYTLPDHKLKPLAVSFETAWDLHQVKPAFFPVPASVVRGRRVEFGAHAGLSPAVESWSGRLPRINVSWQFAGPLIRRALAQVQSAKGAAPSDRSPYHSRFSQGATAVPRVLFFVDERPVGPLGAGMGRVEVRSRRSTTEKQPWRSLPAMEGSVDRQFVQPMHLGDTILPYRILPPRKVVVPWDGRQLLTTTDQLSLHPGLADWWMRAESLWTKHRSSERLSLLQRIDYQRTLSNQLPVVPDSIRVVYSKSGMYLAAAVVTDSSLIDHKLYWGTMASLDEGRYLESILNSDSLLAKVRPLQARGQHNPRDFDKYVWQVAIPSFDPRNVLHQRLAVLAAEAEGIAAAVALPEGKRFETKRRLVREAVRASPTGIEIESSAAAVLRTS